MQANAIVDILSEYNTKRISCNRVAVYTANNRNDLLLDIHNKISGSLHITHPISISSIGCVKKDNLIIVVKPILGSNPGIENEYTLYNKIQYHTNPNPIDIIFRDTTKDYKVKGVIYANLVFSSIGNKKADITLFTETGNTFSFSLKQDDAEIWESADSYFSEEAALIIQKSSALIHDNGSHYRIEPQIAVKATSEEERRCIFGSDIYGSGAVLIRSYRDSDFVRIDNTLCITVSKIIQNLRNLHKEHSVYFLIRNDKTRNSIPNYPGLRSMATFRSRISSRTLIMER